MKTLTKILGIGTLTLASLGFFGCQADMIHSGEDNDGNWDCALEKDGNYPGVVVFAYGNQPEIPSEKQRRFDALKNGIPEINALSVQDWYTKEAKKYGKQISVPLTLFPEDVKIPSKYIKDEFIQLDLGKFNTYLRDNYPTLKNYDFVAVYYSVPTREGSAEGHARPELGVFCLQLGIQFANRPFAHEFAHLLDATDKYDKHDLKNQYDPKDIMKTIDSHLNENVLVSEPTAEEIGWK